MKLIDLLTIIFLAIGLMLAIAAYILIKRNILIPAMYPKVFGIGALIFGFVSLTTSSVLLRPSSEFMEYTLENGLLSGLLAIISYISGRIIERGQKK